MQQLKKNQPSKQAATQRAAQLKQRLDTLKAMMLKLPPGDYKMLARELKQIAKELASLSKQLGNSGGSPATNFPVAAAEQAAAAVATAESAPDTATAEAQAGQAAGQAESIAREATAEATDNETDNEKNQLNPLPGSQKNTGEADDKALRSILAEARKVLKEVVALLKIKHQTDDKETRKLFADIEREIKELDDNLSHLPAGLDAVSSAIDSIPMDTNIGSFIDTSV